MKVLVFTPDHIFHAEEEKTLNDLRIGFRLDALAHTSFISARQDIDVRSWSDLEEILALHGDHWNSILVPLRMTGEQGRAGMQFDRDLEALQKLARRHDRKNVVALLTPECNGHSAKLKNTLVSSGILFVHEAREGYYMLHNWLVAASAMGAAVPGAQMLSVGPLKIDFMGRKITLDDAPVQLNRHEYRLLLHLASHHGKMQPIDALQMCMTNDVQEVSYVHQALATLRRKITTPHYEGNSLVRTVPGGFMLVTDKDLREDAFKAVKTLDFGRFQVVVQPDGSGNLVGHDVILDARDLRILEYMKNRAGEYLLPADIAAGAFAGMNVSGLSVGKKIGSIQRRFSEADPVLGASIAQRYKNKFNHVMFLPPDVNVEAAEKLQLYREVTKLPFGWFDLEISTQFNRKNAYKAARVAGTDIILDPRQTAVLLYAHKNHGEWLVGRLIRQDELGPATKAEEFFRHMKRTFDMLKAGGLSPERFMQFDEKSYVRFLRQDGVYTVAQSKRLPVPLVLSDEVVEKLDAGGWCTLEIRKGGAGVITQTNRALNQTATAIFRYAIQNPGSVLNAQTIPQIFPQGLSRQSFSEAVKHLQAVLKHDGYDEAIYAEPAKGAVFLSKETILAHKGNLHGYFTVLAQRAKDARENALQTEKRFIGPVLPVRSGVSPH